MYWLLRLHKILLLAYPNYRRLRPLVETRVNEKRATSIQGRGRKKWQQCIESSRRPKVMC